MNRPIFLLLSALVLLGSGCTGAAPPVFRIADVEMPERTEESALIRFTIEGDNPNREQLPLAEVKYTVSIEGHPPFTARRSAQTTLPGFRTQSFTVPVALTRENGPIPTGRLAYSIRGTVAYRQPGTIADLLFDNDIRKPTAPFGESGTLDFSGAAPSARTVDPIDNSPDDG